MECESGPRDLWSLCRSITNSRLRTIDGGEAPNPRGVGQQVEHGKLRPEQPGAGAYGRVRAAEHAGRDRVNRKNSIAVIATADHTVRRVIRQVNRKRT